VVSSWTAERSSASRSRVGRRSIRPRMRLRSCDEIAESSAGRSLEGKAARVVGDVFAFGTRFGAAFLVEDDVPDDADQPDAIIADFAEARLVAEHAQEGFLHGVLGFGGVARDRKSDAVQRGRVLGHQRRRSSGSCSQSFDEQARPRRRAGLQSNSSLLILAPSAGLIRLEENTSALKTEDTLFSLTVWQEPRIRSDGRLILRSSSWRRDTSTTTSEPKWMA